MAKLCTDKLPCEIVAPEKAEKPHSFHWREIIWRNVLLFAILHLLSSYALYRIVNGQVLWQTVGLSYIFGIMTGLGITAGAHRLWCHRSYKARWPLRLLLAFFNTMALQNDLHEWVRDHRAHHQFPNTNADPHNSRRGFFFSHMGWVLLRKHPDVLEKRTHIDMSDIEADPIVSFQRKHYVLLVILCWALLPTVLPMYYWRESLLNSFHVCVLLRYTASLHNTWLANSAAHLYGSRPYNGKIEARDNVFVANMAFGDGFQNYHHTFPWDFSASEHSWDIQFNASTMFIDLMAKLGLAYVLKRATRDMIASAVRKLGNGEQAVQVQSGTPCGLSDLLVAVCHLALPLWFAYTLKLASELIIQ